MLTRPVFAAATLVLCISEICFGGDAAETVSYREAREAMHRAVGFFRQHAASEGGGYVYRISEDLKKREGEGAVGPSTAWVEPPSTPSVGLAYLNAYRLTGDQRLRDAALETAEALVHGQLKSGGWDNRIEFDHRDRRNYAYRTGEQEGKRNVTTLDDDKSQSAARFLMQLDQTLEFQNKQLHEAVQYALDSFLRAQFANGAWPQRYSDFPDPEAHPPLEAGFPDDWPREFPGRDYKGFYTLNDDTMSDMIETMLLAHRVYEDSRCLEAAKRAGDFFLRAQLPAPQPGWAQQYDQQMHPAWARKFEPPAITGGESQGVMFALLRLYRATGEKKYLEPIPRAIAYYRSVLLSNGQLARFYEIGTDRPLYFTKDYQLTYSDDDMPTHYGFKVGSKLDAIELQYERLIEQPPETSATETDDAPSKPRLTEALTRRAQELVASLDVRGAWVEDGRLRYHGVDDETRRVIDSRTFIKNLSDLARYVAATKPDHETK